MKSFDAKYLTEEFRKVSSHLSEPVNAYLVGGCALALREMKAVTKDVDIVLTKPKEVEALQDALLKTGYHDWPYPFATTHKRFRNTEGFAWELLQGVIYKSLTLSNAMLERAAIYKKVGKLNVLLLSLEDILLFKMLSDRKSDFEDSVHISSGEISWTVVISEILQQPNVIAYLLFRRLSEAMKVSGISTPQLKNVWKDQGNILVPYLITDILDAGPLSIQEVISHALITAPASRTNIQATVIDMRWRGVIIKEKKGSKVTLRLVDETLKRELSAARERFHIVGAIQVPTKEELE
jgi:hypothetical protein